MAQRVQDQKPKRSKAAQAWIDENVHEQRQRYHAIVQEMEALAPERAGWYQEFLDVIQTRGFNVSGDTRRKIRSDELPRKPDREDRVIY